jgi:hypothetical protein
MSLGKMLPVAALVLILAVIVSVGVATRQASAQRPVDPGEEIPELKKRVARLEAEVAQMRRGLRLAGGGPAEQATPAADLRELATLRAADLLRNARNVHAVLKAVRSGKLKGRALLVNINDFNNGLGGLWITLAGYGLAGEPSLGNIAVSDSGFSRAAPPPDYGIPGPYPVYGMPRLLGRYLAAKRVKEGAAARIRAEFEQLVEPYSNPAVFPFRDFGNRAYNDYRGGKDLDTPQFKADLKAIDQWLTALEGVLVKVPGYFGQAPGTPTAK